MAFVYETSDFKNGLKVLIEGQPYIMTYFQFVKPGKGTAFTRTKLKSLLTGNVIERTYRTGETLEPADCEEVQMQYQWTDGEEYHFMDETTGDQVAVPHSLLDGAEGFFTENIVVSVMLFNGRPVGVTLPNFIETTIAYSEPGARGNSASGNVTKSATLETGAEIQVPLFVNVGDKVKVDTRTREYVSRIGK